MGFKLGFLLVLVSAFSSSGFALGGDSEACAGALDPVVQLLTQLSEPRPVIGSGQDSLGVTAVLNKILRTGLISVEKLPEPLTSDELFGGGYIPELPNIVDQIKFEYAPSPKLLKLIWLSQGKVVRRIKIRDMETTTPVTLNVHKVKSGFLVMVQVEHEVSIKMFSRIKAMRKYELNFDFTPQGVLTELDVYTIDVSGTTAPEYARRISRLKILPDHGS